MAVPLGPWDVAVDPPPLFADCEMRLPVPHTYRVQSTCIFCGGSGRYTNDNDIYSHCPHCKGTGWMRYFSCHGEGWVPCARCGMKGLLLCQSELTITWKNSVAEYAVDKNQRFPLSRFQEVTGKELFSDERHLVTPQNFPQPIVQGTESCLALH